MDRALALERGEIDTFVVEAHRACGSALKETFPELSSLATAVDRESGLRSKLPEMLWFDLRRLRILRNKVEHEDFEPDEGDRDITAGTIKKLRAFLGQAPESKLANKRDWQAFQGLTKEHFEKCLGVPLLVEVEIPLDAGQIHRFDLASTDHSVLIECKSYTWTAGGNEPAAKLNHARTDAQYLKASSAKKRMLVFEDDLHRTKGSLAEVFARRNKSWLGNVEIWRYLNSTFERIYPGGSQSV